MSAIRFSPARQVIRHCNTHGASVRSVVTDLSAVAPRVYVICADRTFMMRPEAIPDLVREIDLPSDVLTFLLEHQLVPEPPAAALTS